MNPATVDSLDHPALDGNMTFLPSTSGGGAGGEGWYFQWNGENRLSIASNSVAGVTVQNTYDHMGRRISKIVDDGANVTTNTFLYDGWNLIRELTHSQTHSLVPTMTESAGS